MFIVEKEPKSMVAESYRTLRTNIQYSSFDKEYRVIVVTSAEPEEGKSTTSGNLALCMAQGDKKIMLIDCDLRKPSLHKKFKISNLLGLSDVMIGKADLASVTHRYNKNLFLLTSGKIPPNPSEMLSSKAMSYLLESLKETFDYIILDTPPLKVVTDSQILSTKADGTILVVRAERTKKESVKNAVDLLKKVNANIIGMVLNGIDVSRSEYYYDYE
ncbi:MAG: CpsD/CapB family tyrosine-protein kinase [Clostridium sp.]|uniref:CpsD/CapB family tyrosine-protein kinase n=1 Tax=Clostridium sp. TaxID=1506 RepID=UPI00290652F6|nr:CpsD/CapB family tyrosine-protein kinase [Clostridium sp.]MDU5109598.1 CpsD/CapB family tyrosine-protein kinase [Clostridium sp.]